MAYSKNSELPQRVRDVLPDSGQTAFRHIVNNALKEYGDDKEGTSRAYATAWKALQNQGWRKGKDGTWMKTRKHVFEMDVIGKRVEGHVVFGYSSIVTKLDGTPMVDLQGDLIEIEDLAEAVYEYVEESRVGGEMHDGEATSILIESMVFTMEKLRKMGIPEGSIPLGWWTGYRVSDDTFARVQEGARLMFSIEGVAVREPVEE